MCAAWRGYTFISLCYEMTNKWTLQKKRSDTEQNPEHVLVPKSGSSSVIWKHFGFKPDNHKQKQTLDGVYLQVVAAPHTNKYIVTITVKQ